MLIGVKDKGPLSVRTRLNFLGLSYSYSHLLRALSVRWFYLGYRSLYRSFWTTLRTSEVFRSGSSYFSLLALSFSKQNLPWASAIGWLALELESEAASSFNKTQNLRPLKAAAAA